MPEPVYPLEQRIQLRHTFQSHRFAEDAAALIVASGRVHSRADGDSLVLEGIGELDLEAAIELLMSHYGDRLMVGPPRIKFILEPRLLEPNMKVVVEVPPPYMGEVTGDLSGRRGLILEMSDVGELKRITAVVPLAEMFGYATVLRRMSQGRGRFQMEFLDYRPAPGAPPPDRPAKAAAMPVPR